MLALLFFFFFFFWRGLATTVLYILPYPKEDLIEDLNNYSVLSVIIKIRIRILVYFYKLGVMFVNYLEYLLC